MDPQGQCIKKTLKALVKQDEVFGVQRFFTALCTFKSHLYNK